MTFPIDRKSFKIPWFQSPPTRYIQIPYQSISYHRFPSISIHCPTKSWPQAPPNHYSVGFPWEPSSRTDPGPRWEPWPPWPPWPWKRQVHGVSSHRATVVVGLWELSATPKVLKIWAEHPDNGVCRDHHFRLHLGGP